MQFNHSPVKKLHHRPEQQTVMETIVYHLSPEQIGRIGGEMAQRMVHAAQGYLEDLAVEEVKKAFYKEIRQGMDGNSITSKPNSKTASSEKGSISSPNAEAPSIQYPAETGPH